MIERPVDRNLDIAIMYTPNDNHLHVAERRSDDMSTFISTRQADREPGFHTNRLANCREQGRTNQRVDTGSPALQGIRARNGACFLPELSARAALWQPTLHQASATPSFHQTANLPYPRDRASDTPPLSIERLCDPCGGGSRKQPGQVRQGSR
ncbi:MAG: hypothetical protein DWQ08_03345 [Proteobacteria bacterium]|nr:MAG: hypothetical protein DWQ08_03345 [Pseudomonadota bacterium]